MRISDWSSDVCSSDLRDRRVEMMAHHQHVQMLVDGVDREGHGGVGGAGDHVGETRQLQYVGRMAAARALGMEGVDGPPLEGGYGVLDKAAFVDRKSTRLNSSH